MLDALVDPAALPGFKASLSGAELIFPLYRGEDEDVDPTNLTVLKREGHEGIAAYTSTAQIARALPEGGPCVKMTGARFAEGWDGATPVLLNPGGDLGLVIDAATIEDWRGA